jgi:ribosomal protein S14
VRHHKYSLRKKLKNVTNAKLIRNHLLRYLKKCCNAPKPVRQYALLALTLKHNHGYTRTKIHTFCIVTGRIRYTIRDTYTSRLTFGDFLRSGNLVGFSHGS